MPTRCSKPGACMPRESWGRCDRDRERRRPQVGGGYAGRRSLRDYGRGVNLSDIAAEVVGQDGALQIKSFKATAVSGSVGMTGTFGVLQPGLPLDLKITAKMPSRLPAASSRPISTPICA